MSQDCLLTKTGAWARCLAVALAAVAIPAAAAEQPPKIGLVLSGGGARGGAHIGVLQVLEEMRVPVDCVAGTSMGSIIGGLYSVGYDPDDLAEIVQNIDWDAAFRDQPVRKRLSFRRKEDDDLPLWPLEIGIGGHGPSGPAGLTTASRIEFIFRSLTLDAAGIHDFDDLPIPYRAVAADLDSGDPVVLEGGELALAMRASMSIPAVFTPVELDGRLLVDGGIAMNLPVEVAQAMGADVIIAVDVGTPTRHARERLSPMGVYSQTFSVLAKENVARSLARLGGDDLLIVPDLSEVKTGDFKEINKAIASGEAAARAVADELGRYAVSAEEYAQFLARQRRDRREADRLTVDEVVVEGVTRTRPDVVRRRVRTAAGSELDPDLLMRDLDRVSQAGEFEAVGFRVEREDERNRLAIEVREKTWGPGYLRFGLGLAADFEGDTEFRMLANYRRANVNRLGAEWKTIVSLGDPSLITTELFQPLEPSGFWFVAPNLTYFQDRDDAYLAGDELEVLDVQTAVGGLDFGIQIRNYGEVRLGAYRGNLEADPRTASAFVPFESDLGFARLQATVDQLDNVAFPTQGNRTTLDVVLARDSLGADDEYDRLLFSTTSAKTWGRNTFVGGVEFGTDLDSDLPFYEEFQLGGFLKLSGIERGRLRGNAMGLIALGDYWRLGELGPLGKLYAGLIAQAGNVWEDDSDADLGDLIYSGTLFFGVDMRLSPVYLAYGHAEGGESAAYLFVGKPFGR
jgi:NTE family protein